MPEEFVPPMEPAGVSAQQPFHARDQIGLGRLHHQMKMIRHEDVGMNLPTSLRARFAQRLDQTLPIRVVLEDRFAPVAPIHHMIHCPRILDSQFARPARRRAAAPSCVNLKN